ncbi:efflux RND transporter permease subunit [Amylibacter sp. SFDW26]|uniref:efflux RND transporter permease subunit n=1 Tax=Amylibacter sp. SFDW26 TaxID=2652722 RepID=UPI0012623D9A|nr:efflux RND transporter permease subunit [Amylibacter sp. SFDW26]KAB7616239.1 efflux RND transporter permease subunit [Amylibacter sp. SFDW26]
MVGIVDWASSRARMIIAFILMSLAAGWLAYTGLPKEGEPDIDIPFLFVSVPFPGISAADSEKLLVKPLETKLKELEGLKTMTATAAENYGGVGMEFEFGWDKEAVIAEVRDKVSQAEAEFPEGAEQYTINEVNFSQFPIIVVSLSGGVPERTLLRVAKELQTELEGLSPVLEAGLAGHRDEMLEVLIDPLKLEAYNVTAGELLNVVQNNNQLIAAGEVETDSGAFAVKIPSSFDEPQDVYNLPVKVNGDSVITLGDLAEIRLTFEDRLGTARYNGDATVALQIVKRKGANHIETAQLVRDTVTKEMEEWPLELKQAIRVDFTLDQSKQVASMIGQLEGSVLTAILLVMIVVLGALGIRSALLVGFAIPTSFLLAFAFMAVAGLAISNMVMFGLILAVGMLVDGAIVVVEYADKRIRDGVGPMQAYVAAAKRMFWPIISSTATTLCAFLPMLFWPGVPGEFMRNLPITLIYVLAASLLVALVYLPIVGGVAGRLTRLLEDISNSLRSNQTVTTRVTLLIITLGLILGSIVLVMTGMIAAAVLTLLLCFGLSAIGGSLTPENKVADRDANKRTPFGKFIQGIVSTAYMPLVAILATFGFVAITFMTFTNNNKGVEFFVDQEPENGIIYVRARGNLSLEEKDKLVREVETRVASVKNVESVFAFAGEGGLDQNTGGAQAPLDTVGQIQFELDDWKVRGTGTGQAILDNITEVIQVVPGIQAEILVDEDGPAAGKALNLRVLGDNWPDLLKSARLVRAHFNTVPGLKDIEDTTPLPGIDWQIDVDVEEAGRYGADVASVGAMVQLVTRGLLLDTMRVDSSEEEIDIRVRVPEEDRLLSTLDSLRVRTATGLIPLSNFISRTPVSQLGQINRVDTARYFDVKADVLVGVNANEKIAEVTEWMEKQDLPAGIDWEWSGNQEDEEESGAFLQKAFIGAMGLMFVILLAQFNSFYNSILVLLAVVLSTTGVLIGMMVMGQPFSIIMTGTGIVALAGIVVNNNIVLIDTYQEYSTRMPKLEAIVATAEARIRPVLLTTITTMAGLTPMMLGLSIDFADGGYSLDAPTALWWKQLATAVVFGLGIATILTLVLTPAMLALRVWVMACVKYLSNDTKKTGGKKLSLHDTAYADIAK